MTLEDPLCCGNCIHFEPKYSECRCFTPTHVENGTGLGVWPIVDMREGWCGQFDDGEDLEVIIED